MIASYLDDDEAHCGHPNLCRYNMTEKKLLSFAEFLIAEVPGMSKYSTSFQGGQLIKFEYPKDWYVLAEMCMHYYRTDPIVSNTLNKIVDVGLRGYYLNRGDCSDEEIKVYNSVTDLLILNLKELVLEYLLSGLVVPEVIWHEVPGDELDSGLSGNYIVPEVLWKRDPSSLELKKTPIPNRVNVFAVPSDDDIQFIRNKGVYPDGTEDKETYQLLKQQYPEYVRAIRAGRIKFKLEDSHLIRRKPLDDSPYPTPYLLPALERLDHKRNLQKMDYAIAARVIAAILLFRMGSDDYPLTEDDHDQVLKLKQQLLWRGHIENPERLFQLFANHTLQIDWITPDVSALLDDKKYDAVNLDILFALGFPRILLTGETARTGTSTPEFALLSAAETIKSIRDAVMSWPKEVYKQMREKNNFKNIPYSAFEEIRLYDISKIIMISDILYQRGAISKSTFAKLGGFDFEHVELPARVHEDKLIKTAGITEFPLLPYSENPPVEKKGDNDPKAAKE